MSEVKNYQEVVDIASKHLGTVGGAGYKVGGSVIHEVTSGVDEGRVISSREVSLDGLDLDGTFRILRDTSQSLWVDFLKTKLDENRQNSISWSLQYGEDDSV